MQAKQCGYYLKRSDKIPGLEKRSEIILSED